MVQLENILFSPISIVIPITTNEKMFLTDILVVYWGHWTDHSEERLL